MRTYSVALASFVAALCLTTRLNAGTVDYAQPDSTYTGLTTLLDITAPDFDLLDSLGDGNLSVSFSSAMEIRRTSNSPGGSWLTWGFNPYTEGFETPLLFTGAQMLTLMF